jgi:hypothetical protein
MSRLGNLSDDERLCIDRGMEQWVASLSRPDLTERDRVGGALMAYCGQAFALKLTALPAERPSDAEGEKLVERLRDEARFLNGDAVAWGLDSYADRPRVVTLLAKAADAIASLTAQQREAELVIKAAAEGVERCRYVEAHNLLMRAIASLQPSPTKTGVADGQ